MGEERYPPGGRRHAAQGEKRRRLAGAGSADMETWSQGKVQIPNFCIVWLDLMDLNDPR